MTETQRKWLASYDPVTGSLRVDAGRVCGCRELVKAEYVTDGGFTAMPKLMITAKGLIFLEQNPA
jgi:hypothetical protein